MRGARNTKEERNREQNVNAAPADGADEVDFLIPRATPEDRPVFLGVNGESIRVKPGEPVRVKRRFVEVWESARAQERDARDAVAGPSFRRAGRRFSRS